MKNFLEIILKQPKLIISINILLCLFFGFLTTLNLKINTSTDSLIKENLDFKKNQKKLKQTFKILNNNILIRIKAKDQDDLSAFGQSIISKLEANNAVSFVYSPNFDEVFKKNFFLFSNDLEKIEIVEKLYEYQPFLSQINNHKNKLEGFNNLLELSIKKNSKEDLKNFSNIFLNFSDSLKKKETLDWKKLLSNQSNDFFILFGIKENYLKANDFTNFYNFLNSLRLKTSPEIQIDFTGGLIIDYEEISSVASGAILSGILSFILVGFILWLAFRNFFLIFSILITIASGLIITLGLTTIFIGSLNLISVAFAVLFIGLSVDYGIQVCSRILERVDNFKEGITPHILSVSKTLLLASIPSIIGFLSFVPTNYVGLSELGIISAIGLVVGFLLNIILLPSILNVNSKIKKSKFICLESYNFLNFIFKNQNMVIVFFFLILSFTLLNFNKINFDFDALNLKDQNLQSVKLAKEIIEKNPTSDYIVSIIFNKNEAENFNKSHPIFKDENIKDYFSFQKVLSDYENDELDYLKFLLSPNLLKKDQSQVNEIENFKLFLQEFVNKDLGDVSIHAKKLLKEISILEDNNFTSDNITDLMFNGFQDLIKFIKNLGVMPIGFQNSIPDYFKNRYVNNNSFYRVEIFPLKDISIPKNLRSFVNVFDQFFPNATGMPVVQLKAGEVVTGSFLKALSISLTFLLLFLFFIFKKKIYVFLCFCSLISAFILTVFFMIVLKINLNFANMISLPLLFSLGISYSIYFLKRHEELGGLNEIFKSNTPLAILFSGLTTIFSFSTLYLSPHSGTSSMGALLFISLMTTLISSLILLPLFIRLISFK